MAIRSLLKRLEQARVPHRVGEPVRALLTGVNDWASLTVEQRRAGLVRVLCTSAALALYAGSVVARFSGNPDRGRRLAYAGLAFIGVGATVRRPLSHREPAAVEQGFPRIPDGWHDLCDYAALCEGTPTIARIGNVPVLVHRTANTVTAVIPRRVHRTGTSHVDGAVRSWHSGTVRLADGVARAEPAVDGGAGPAACEQPALRTRVRNGRVAAARL
jgi:nitrite reductase/ring-hydroxylating ferredoxin subunit